MSPKDKRPRLSPEAIAMLTELAEAHDRTNPKELEALIKQAHRRLRAAETKADGLT